MTDSEFVLWYVEKHYLFTGIKFKKKYLNEDPITYAQLVNNVSYSLAIEKIDGQSLFNFMSGWYKNKQVKSKEDVLDFIRFKYKIILGYRNWEISRMNGQIVTINRIVSDFKNKYDNEFVESIINDWFENQIINQSEKIILNFK